MSTTWHARYLLLLSLIPIIASAQDVEFLFDNKILGGAEFVNFKDSSNPFMDKALKFELRPSLILNYRDTARLTFRPRFESSSGSLPGPEESFITRRDIWINEGYFSYFHPDQLEFHIGRQNYLWGPSELTGPSNPFYADVLNRPNPLFLLRGVTLARMNYSIGSEYTLTGMVELNSLNDANYDIRFPQKDENKHRALLKAGYSSDSGVIDLGISVGQNKCTSILEGLDTYCRFAGGYLMWTINSALQPYADFRIDDANGSAYPFGVAGLRYTFEGGTEWRNEYIYKKLGLNSKETDQLEALLANPSVSATQILQQDTLLYEEYYYSSLRFRPSGSERFLDPIIGVRSLYALTNQSGIGSLYLEGGLSDYFTFTSYLAQTYGPKDSDYNRLFYTLFGIYLTYSHE